MNFQFVYPAEARERKKSHSQNVKKTQSVKIQYFFCTKSVINMKCFQKKCWFFLGWRRLIKAELLYTTGGLPSQARNSLKTYRFRDQLFWHSKLNWLPFDCWSSSQPFVLFDLCECLSENWFYVIKIANKLRKLPVPICQQCMLKCGFPQLFGRNSIKASKRTLRYFFLLRF